MMVPGLDTAAAPAQSYGYCCETASLSCVSCLRLKLFCSQQSASFSACIEAESGPCSKFLAPLKLSVAILAARLEGIKVQELEVGS